MKPTTPSPGKPVAASANGTADADLRRGIERAVELIGAGRPDQAVRQLRDLDGRWPEHFDVLHLWGAAAVLDGRLDEGIRLLQRATASRPAAPAAWVNLGGAFEKAGRWPEAAEAFGAALKGTPDLAEASHRRTMALLVAGSVTEAAAQADAFAERYYRNDTARISVGLVRLREGRPEEAIEAFRKAVEINPASTLARANLGYALGMLGRFGEAAAALKEVVARRPGDWPALEKLIFARRAVCDWEGLGRSEQTLLKAVADGATVSDPCSLLALTDRADLLKAVAVRGMAGLFPRPPASLRAERPFRHERIRVGLVSADFHDHPVAHVVADAIEAIDRSRFEVVGVSYGAPSDHPARARLERTCDTFLDVHGEPAEAIARTLRTHEIDIAVDLSGPTEAGEPRILAYRPARVQVSWLGYPGTTGAPWIDYIVADPVTAPPGSDQHFSEAVVRLPDTYFPPARRDMAVTPPTRAEAGLPEAGVVFASFNATFMLAPALFEVWMRIVAAVPDSVLWHGSEDELAMRDLRAAAGRQGVAPERLVFAPRIASGAEHLARLGLADLVLDTICCSAQTGTSDALWAGVPVLTLPGASFASRVGASLVTAADLSGLVAADMAGYEAEAVALGRDPARLGQLKAQLVAGRATSRLFDVARFARHLEAALAEMHARDAAGQRPAAFDVAVTAPGAG